MENNKKIFTECFNHKNICELFKRKLDKYKTQKFEVNFGLKDFEDLKSMLYKPGDKSLGREITKDDEEVQNSMVKDIYNDLINDSEFMQIKKTNQNDFTKHFKEAVKK